MLAGSLADSLARSLTRSQGRSLTRSLTCSQGRSPAHSLARFPCHAPWLVLARLLVRWLTRWMPMQPGCREFVGHAGDLHPLPLFSLTEYHRIICCTLRWKRLQWHPAVMRQASMTSSSKKVALKEKKVVFAPQWTQAMGYGTCVRVGCKLCVCTPMD